MKKGLFIGGAVILLLGAAVCVGGLVMLDGNWKALDRHEYVTSEYKFDDEIDSFEFVEYTAALEFKPSEDNSSKLVIRELSEAKHAVKVEEGKLSVKESSWEHSFIDWFKFGPVLENLKATVYLPIKCYENVFINSSTGSVSISDGYTFNTFEAKLATGAFALKNVTATSLKVKASTGGVSLRNCDFGSIDVESATGSIAIEDTNAKTVYLNCSTGSIGAKNMAVSDSFMADCSTGSIGLKDVTAINLISLKCGTGSISLIDSDAPNIELKTATGSIRAVLLSGKTYDVSSKSGSVKKPSDDPSGGTLTARSASGSINISVR